MLVQKRDCIQADVVESGREFANGKDGDRQDPTGWVAQKYISYVPPSADRFPLVDYYLQLQSDGEYIQLFSIDIINYPSNKVQLTKASHDIISVLNVDEEYIYLMAAAPRATDRNLYQVRFGTSVSFENWNCLTCGRTFIRDRLPCEHATVKNKLGSGYVSFTCNGPDIPYSIITVMNGNELQQGGVVNLADMVQVTYFDKKMSD